MSLPRLWHRWYAALFGYFWTDCPLCGYMFGGHEWKEYGGKAASIPTDAPFTFTAICPPCTKSGQGVDRSVRLG